MKTRRRVLVAAIALVVACTAGRTALAQWWGRGGSVRYSASFVNRYNDASWADRQQYTDLHNRYSIRGSRWTSGYEGVNAYGDQSMTGADAQLRMQSASVRPANYGSIHSAGGRHTGPTTSAFRYAGFPTQTTYAPPSPSGTVPSGLAYANVGMTPTFHVMPDDAKPTTVDGKDYVVSGYNWFVPNAGGTGYKWTYPPVGYWYASLPEGATIAQRDGKTCHYRNGVYYQDAARDGKKGYAVAERPEGVAAEPAVAATGPDALQILESACDHISDLDRFSGVIETEYDEVRPDGSKVKLAQRRIIYLSRPDRITADVTGDGENRRLVYDSGTLSILDRTNNTWSRTPMPGTIDNLIRKLSQDYGMVMPLGDFLREHAYEDAAAEIVSSQYLGTERVGRTDCYHLAFVGRRADFQLWISTGDAPVPWKIIIDYRNAPARPRYSSTLQAWIEDAPFAPGTFDFQPPAGARLIELKPARPSPEPTPPAP